MKNKSNTSKFDNLYTPMYTIQALVSELNKFEELKNKQFLEPFSIENCNITKIMKFNNYKIEESGLEHSNKKNFFDIKKEDIEDVDIIISNPPFSLKTQVLEHTVFNLEKDFIYLFPLDVLSSEIRENILDAIQDNLSILFFTKRTNFFNPTKFNNQSGYMYDLCFITNISLIGNRRLEINKKEKLKEDKIMREVSKNTNKDAIPTLAETKIMLEKWNKQCNLLLNSKQTNIQEFLK